MLIDLIPGIKRDVKDGGKVQVELVRLNLPVKLAQFNGARSFRVNAAIAVLSSHSIWKLLPQDNVIARVRRQPRYFLGRSSRQHWISVPSIGAGAIWIAETDGEFVLSI